MNRPLMAILLIALALRLIAGLSLDPALPYADTGSDTRWYLANGYTLVTGRQSSDLPVDVSQLSIPPLYLILIGGWQAVLAPEAAVIAIRITQAILGAASCAIAYGLALRLTQNSRAGLLAAAVIAISPVFILESTQILTETLYIFLVSAGLLAYTSPPNPVRSLPMGLSMMRGGAKSTGGFDTPLLARRSGAIRRGVRGEVVLAGALLGLATLTRAVLLLFPLGLAIHLLMLYGWREGLRRAGVLLLVYGLVVSTWTVYNLARWERLVIAGTGIAANVYVAATDWRDPSEIDAELAAQGELPDEANSAERQQAYLDAAAATISGDPVGYVRKRISSVAESYLQPHGTLFFPGESLRDLALGWWRDDRSVGGLLALTGGDGFWPKLAIYLFHYAGLIFGLAGMWHYRRRWPVALPMIGFIAYTTLLHLLLLAVPRYIFPTEIFWWVFAAGIIMALAERKTHSNDIPVGTRFIASADGRGKPRPYNDRDQ